VARRILENDPDEDLDESEDQSLEFMVGTAPFSQIRANPMAWALFMRGYEVGRHFRQMTTGDLQQDHGHDPREFQHAAPWQNQISEMSTPSVDRYVERGLEVQVMEATATPAVMVVVEEAEEEIVTLSVDDALSPWLEDVLALMEEPQSTPTEAEHAHVPSAVEDLTSPGYHFLFDDDNLEH